MIRYTLLWILFSYKSFCQNENKLSYDRQFFNSNNLYMIEDKFQFQYQLKQKITLFSSYYHSDVSITPKSIINYSLNNIYNLSLGIIKEFDLENGSSFKMTINPQFATNDFKSSSFNNTLLNSNLLFKKKIKDNTYIDLGIEYGNLFGSSRFYPIFSFNKSINKEISFSVGFPNSDIKYHINQKHRIQLNSSYSTYFSKINNSFSSDMNQYDKGKGELFLSSIRLSLQYNYIFYNGSVVNLTFGKSFNNKIDITQGKDFSSSYGFNNSEIISVGFKYNLNFK